MEKEQRSRLQKATQDARRLLEQEFTGQLLQTYDINVGAGRWNDEPGAHLQVEQRLIRKKLVAWIGHKEAQINDRKEALLLALREMAFTALNRFVALKLMEARELVRPCVTGGLESEGFQEFTAVAQGLLADQEGAYRLYLETIFEDVSRELRALFDPRDRASLLWPKRTALLDLLEILNRPELGELWKEDETLGWVYQYFNGDAERKKMREESSAPRNSRELAVRNQFFTPRYVVEFLTDNTLGRIWYEMRKGQTGLKERCRYLVRRPNEIWLQPGEEAPAQVESEESLTQKALLQQPVPIPHRPLKDPREIRMLDPACGSMHFGLYAFDLYLEIYAEAWEIARGSDEQVAQGEAFAPFVAYAGGFADKAAILREVPRLILLHNIHGIDIDPRATQIARLTLWLRAQRAWQEQQLESPDRPPITRSNVVCAEPMPGERELLADFVDQQFPETERRVVQQLLEAIFDKMQLAGEAGSLLSIEEEIHDAIDEARMEWQRLAVQQTDLFSLAELAAPGQRGTSLDSDLQRLTKDFWIDIEERIYAALGDYAKQAENSDGYERRLFAEDAAQGFAFIDICRKRYDASVMNPPFGNPPDRVTRLISQDAASNIYPAFVLRGAELTTGFVGSITDRTFVVQKSFHKFRARLISENIDLVALADLGWGVLDGADVQVATYIIRKGAVNAHLFTSLDSSGDAAKSLRRTVAESRWTWLTKEQIRKIPNNAFAYTLPTAYLTHLGMQPSLRELAVLPRGLGSNNANRTYKAWYEAPPKTIGPGRRYSSLCNGGPCSPFFRDDAGVAEWLREDGALLVEEGYSDVVKAYDQSNCEHYFSVGLSFPKQSSIFNVAALPQDAIPTREGKGIMLRQPEELLYILGFLNSSYARFFVEATNGLHKQSGPVGMTPVPAFSANSKAELARVALSAWQSIANTYRFDEASRLFVRAAHADELEKGAPLDSSEIFRRIDEIVFRETDVSAEDRAEILSSTYPVFASFIPSVSDALSYALGSAFGRWDIRFATGQQAEPDLSDPFAPLPVCPPGQLQTEEGIPCGPEDVPAGYPVAIAWDGILVDDQNDALDIKHHVREVIEIIWSGKEGGPTSEAIEHEACDILGVKSLRDYFRKPNGFFADHLKRYSKSRRQAPIYWQLSAGSGSYSVWLYFHRFTSDSLYQVLGIVNRRLEETGREISNLGAHGFLSGDEANHLQEAHSLLADLRMLKGELDLVAPLWSPNLYDGVLINHAILWRITPFTPWQKKCKECWDKLVGEAYDWAHLAFHLWPERVIPKCVTDRSLAIAHGLEDRLWQETNDGNWLPKRISDTELQALIAEHTKPAVRSALERFLAAPPPVAPARARAPRAARSSSTGTTRQPRGSTTAVDAEAARQTMLVLTAVPAKGLSRNDIASALDVAPGFITPVIKQLKETGQIEQLGAARGTTYRLTELGRTAVESDDS